MDIGIDIGARKHEVAIRKGKSQQAFAMDNDARGIKELVKRVRGKRCRVVMEATGIYYLDTALALAEAGAEVMVVNPKHGHHFAQALGWHSNTDRISAAMLAEFAQRMPFKAWTPPPNAWLEFRGIARQINRLTTQKAAAKNRLHAHEASTHSSPAVIDDERDAIAMLEQRIDRLTTAAMALVSSDPEIARLYHRFSGAVGIAQTSAIALAGELIILPRTLNAKQCTKHSGLDIILKESGTSVRGKPRISKRGNVYLRSALYMPALVAAQHDPRVKAHQEALKARGKTTLQARCAIMRKYLTGLWAVVRNDEPFDSAKLFPNALEA